MTADDPTTTLAACSHDSGASVQWLDQQVDSVLDSVTTDRIQTFKEFVRHGLFHLGLFRCLNVWRRMRGVQVSEGSSHAAETRFKEIYVRGLWVRAEGQESLSGTGSSRTATAGLITSLMSGMSSLGCNSLLDVGCGDWNWMQHETLPVDYVGVDVVESVIARNQTFSGPRVRFAVCNAISQPLPSVDMALCREVLFHLSFADARSVLVNISRSARFLCATTDVDIRFNSDIPTGDFRPLNLLIRPFGLPMPQALIPDRAVRPGRFLGVWSSAALSAALSRECKERPVAH